MLRRILNLLVVFIVTIMIMSIMNISNATEISETEKHKIENFLNEEDNLVFSYHNYSKASEIPLTDEWGIPERISKNYGKMVENYDDPAVKEITHEMKAYTFTKENADTFMMAKMGIKFSDLNDYNLWVDTHTLSSNKNIFYQIAEGYGTEYPEYKIETIETLENGNIKVKVSYGDGLTNVITLKPNGDSYLFVSCVNNNPGYKVSNRPNNSQTTTVTEKTKKENDTTVAKTIIPQTGVTENIIIISAIAILLIIVAIVLVRYHKMKKI